jgi:hypothetical protein
MIDGWAFEPAVTFFPLFLLRCAQRYWLDSAQGGRTMVFSFQEFVFI